MAELADLSSMAIIADDKQYRSYARETRHLLFKAAGASTWARAAKRQAAEDGLSSQASRSGTSNSECPVNNI